MVYIFRPLTNTDQGWSSIDTPGLLLETEMCNRPRLVIDLVIDYDFFQSNRNRNRSFLQNSNRNRNRNPVKKNAFDDYNHRKV